MHVGRYLLTACASIVLACGLAACASSGDKTGSKVTVGLLSDFTGPASSSFSDTKIGTDAYIDYINSRGGVNGRKIKVVVGDTQSSPTGTINAAHKLVQHDHVSAI